MIKERTGGCKYTVPVLFYECLAAHVLLWTLSESAF